MTNVRFSGHFAKEGRGLKYQNSVCSITLFFNTIPREDGKGKKKKVGMAGLKDVPCSSYTIGILAMEFPNLAMAIVDFGFGGWWDGPCGFTMCYSTRCWAGVAGG